jgi:hypothetical protein
VLVEPAVVADSCKVDEYTNVFCEDQQARLDNYALLLEKSSRARGFILVYGGKKDRFGQNPRRREAELRADAIKDYLVNTRGINSARLRTIDGGYRQTWTVELYVCSPETAKPKPTPTLSSNEIRFRTRKVKREEYVVFCG